MKAFETAGFGESPNYSGFNREVWEVRYFTEHRQSAFESRNAQTATLRDQIERKKGACMYDTQSYCVYHTLILSDVI